MLKKATIYSLVGCPYCTKARAFLRKKGYTIQEHKIRRSDSPKRMPNGRLPQTYPQVWIGGKKIGGYDDLVAAKLS